MRLWRLTGGPARTGGRALTAILVMVAVSLLWVPRVEWPGAGAGALGPGAATYAAGYEGAPAQAGVAGAGGLLAPDFVRIQVVANSDSRQDQDVKGLVRDAIRARLGPEVLGFEDAGQALTRVEEMLPGLYGEVSDLLAETGCGYGCSLATGHMAFPAKSYGGVVVPPGTYPALRVTLGEGRGSNWWCVLFPPLCFVDLGSSLAVWGEGEKEDLPDDVKAPEFEDLGDVEAVQAIADALRRVPGQGGPVVRPQLRSWLWEKLQSSRWLRWLFGGGGVAEGAVRK